MASGVAPREIEAAWTVSEFAEAEALQGFDPWGEQRDDLRAAVLATAIVAALTGKRNLDASKFNVGCLLERYERLRRGDPSARRRHGEQLRQLAAMLPHDPPPPAGRPASPAGGPGEQCPPKSKTSSSP